jgi:hypothetical protein
LTTRTEAKLKLFAKFFHRREPALRSHSIFRFLRKHGEHWRVGPSHERARGRRRSCVPVHAHFAFLTAARTRTQEATVWGAFQISLEGAPSREIFEAARMDGIFPLVNRLFVKHRFPLKFMLSAHVRGAEHSRDTFAATTTMTMRIEQKNHIAMKFDVGHGGPCRDCDGVHVCVTVKQTVHSHCSMLYEPHNQDFGAKGLQFCHKQGDGNIGTDCCILRKKLQPVVKTAHARKV